jgi:succinoglycan biosynthesis transport protein ExoP
VGVLATALAGMFLLAPTYGASAKILVTSNRAEISSSGERPTELIRTGQIFQGELNSQVEILTSGDLIAQVLTEMGVPEQAKEEPGVAAAIRGVLGMPAVLLGTAYRRLHGVDDAGRTSAFDAVVAAVRASTDAAPVRNSNVIELTFSGGNPDWARKYVARLTAAYIDRQAKMQRESQAEDFFVQQSELLRQKLNESEGALRQLREKAGTLQGQQAEVHERLNEFNAELARVKIARAEEEQRVAYLEHALTADRHAGRVATPELLGLEARRAELIGRYRPDSERVRDIDQQIQNLRNAISGYDAVIEKPESGARDLTTTRASIAALRGKEEALARERDGYRSQAELLDAQSFDVARLERQVKLDEQAYISYVRTAEESRLSNALEQNKMLRLTVVEPATVPMEPVSPKNGRILLFALVGGLAVSVGAGFVRDQLDRTVKTAAEVRRYGEIEVLAVLPERV